MAPPPGLSPGESQGRKGLLGCGPWGLEESDMAGRLHCHFSLLCIGEGNGSPLQCLAWRIPGTGSHRVGHDWSDSAAQKQEDTGEGEDRGESRTEKGETVGFSVPVDLPCLKMSN